MYDNWTRIIQRQLKNRNKEVASLDVFFLAGRANKEKFRGLPRRAELENHLTPTTRAVSHQERHAVFPRFKVSVLEKKGLFELRRGCCCVT